MKTVLIASLVTLSLLAASDAQAFLAGQPNGNGAYTDQRSGGGGGGGSLGRFTPSGSLSRLGRGGGGGGRSSRGGGAAVGGNGDSCGGTC